MAVVPSTRTWVAGEVVTASHFNSNIRDVLLYLLSPPIMELRQTSAQTIGTGGSFAAFTFTTEDFDSSGMHSNSVNTSRATAVYPGYYLHHGATAYGPNGTGSRGSRWAVNGTEVNSSEIMLPTVGASFNHCNPARGRFLFLNVGDYSELLGWQTSGGNLNTPAGAQAGASFGMIWESN